MVKLLHSAIAFLALSLILVSEGRPSRSQNSPPSPEAAAALESGLTLRSQGKTNDAFAEFDRAIALAPNYTDAQIAKAALLFKQGRSIEAIALYDKILASDRSAIAAYLGKGQALARQGKREEAKTFLRSAQQQFQERGDRTHAEIIGHLLPNL